LLHCCNTVVARLLHCSYKVPHLPPLLSSGITLLSHCYYTAVTLLLHCCYTVVILLFHCCYTGVTLLLHSRSSLAGFTSSPTKYNCDTVVLQWCYSGVTVVLQWCYSGVVVFLCLLTFPHLLQFTSSFSYVLSSVHITSSHILSYSQVVWTTVSSDVYLTFLTMVHFDDTHNTVFAQFPHIHPYA
jgi:hypothetical protein